MLVSSDDEEQLSGDDRSGNEEDGYGSLEDEVRRRVVLDERERERERGKRAFNDG